jgi:hypothetical protein
MATSRSAAPAAPVDAFATFFGSTAFTAAIDVHQQELDEIDARLAGYQSRQAILNGAQMALNKMDADDRALREKNPLASSVPAPVTLSPATPATVVVSTPAASVAPVVASTPAGPAAPTPSEPVADSSASVPSAPADDETPAPAEDESTVVLSPAAPAAPTTPPATPAASAAAVPATGNMWIKFWNRHKGALLGALTAFVIALVLFGILATLVPSLGWLLFLSIPAAIAGVLIGHRSDTRRNTPTA